MGVFVLNLMNDNSAQGCVFGTKREALEYGRILKYNLVKGKGRYELENGECSITYEDSFIENAC